MNMKKFYLLAYAWSSTILFGLFIYWLSTLPNLSAGNTLTDEVIKVSFRMTLYAIFFVLIYRSFILTIKTNVARLAQWKSRREKEEDEEFVLIIETIIVIATIFICFTFAFFEEVTQLTVLGRNNADIIQDCRKLDSSRGIRVKTECIEKSAIVEANKDVLVSLMAILLMAIIVYSIPVIGELEVALKYKFEQGLEKLRKKK